MLREELNNSDIPHHTYIRGQVIETWERYIQTLSGELEDAFVHLFSHILM